MKLRREMWVLSMVWILLGLLASRPTLAQSNDCAKLLERPSPNECEQQYAKPTYSETAIKSLTREQALDIAVWLHLQGKLTLNTQSKPRFDAKCNLVGPKPDEKLSIKWCFRGPKGIVEYKTDLYSPPRRDSIHGLDARLVVGLYRLAKYLNETFDAKEIWHRGIQPGNGPDSVIHNEGRGVDFSGILKTDGTKLTVLKNWSGQKSFFTALYGYLVGQYCDGSPNGKLGEGSQVVTPAHPNATQASRHQDHIHFDIPKGDSCPDEDDYE